MTGEEKYLSEISTLVRTVGSAGLYKPTTNIFGQPTQKKDTGLAMESPSVDPVTKQDMESVRHFTSGATRSSESGKPDFEGFLSPEVIDAYGQYMHKHRLLPDGSLRASDNWQKGIPQDQYMKSLFRHLIQVWQIHRRGKAIEWNTGKDVELKDALCAVIFNAMGMLHEELK